MNQIDRLIVALDVPDAAAAVELCRKLAGHAGAVKIGKELFTAEGPAVVREVRALGLPVFLDLKFHDIPATVKGACRSAAKLGVAMLTIHASGGAAMIKAAVEGAREGAEAAGVAPPLVLAVTVLTSIDQDTFRAVGCAGKVAEGVERLARLAVGAGATGIVCSPEEAHAVREVVGNAAVVVTPGIRPAWMPEKGDQKRVATPEQALRSGATHLVVGRPVTQADDPASAADRVVAEISKVV